ncbi:MAG: cytochrome c biogenesis protein ResB [Planctomycetia bacterium]|nr:cytochrome c biogenesis protein ResB [Planctomycetia bacterium]
MTSTAPRDVKKIDHSPANKPAIQTGATSKAPFWKMARTLGSLHLALTAGSVFTIAMIIGTCLESWYSDKIAQELVYYSWWFTALLGVLALCIFFAAMKKWPWKKHQTGFLITHVGLLTMLAGGVLNSFFGVDAMMRLVDSPFASEQLRIPQRSNEVSLSQQMILSLDRLRQEKTGKGEWENKQIDVKPGPLPWGSELGKSIKVPGLIGSMAWLANPFPRSISTALYDDLRLEVIAHLPHSRLETLEAAESKEFGFPALKLEINTKETMRVKPSWIALAMDQDRNLFPYLNTIRNNMLIEFHGKFHSALIDEFTKPVSNDQRGKQGQLVFAIGQEKIRVDVASNIGKTVPLGKSGWQLVLEKYVPRPNSQDVNESPDFPVVTGEVISPDGKKTKYQIAGRKVEYPGPLDHLSTPTPDLAEGLPAVFYHAPDVRFGYDGLATGRPHIKSLLQFMQTTDGKLYFRTFIEQDGKMLLEDSGEAPPSGVEQRIWDRHAGSFIITEHLPHAKPCVQRVVPITKRPGLLDEENPPALLCRVILTKKDLQNQTHAFSKERWIALGRQAHFAISGTLDNQTFNEPIKLTFGYQQMQLPFSIELTRAESQLDPGTTRAATYTSFVKVNDEKELSELYKFFGGQAYHGDNFMITMNEPLDHRGFKVYQSRFEQFGLDETTGKPMAGSVFTVGRDPGLWLKYLGTGMLGLGIATMYYMKAYFFKPKKRQTV